MYSCFPIFLRIALKSKVAHCDLCRFHCGTIYLTKTEKQVLLHVRDNGKKQPRNISPVMFHYSFSTLKEKGLVGFKTDYDEVISAKLTVKGAAYMEQNPKLKNSIDWKGIITLVMTAITAIATTLALFVACNNRF